MLPLRSVVYESHRSYEQHLAGYCTVGNALSLARLLQRMDRSQVVSKQQFNELVAEMRNERKALDAMRLGIQFVHDQRVKWMNKQPESYWSAKRTKDSCLKIWAANHELSDFMIARVVAGDTNLGTVNFLRYNQWPERADAVFEEAERLVEEKPFGGETQGDKVTVPLDEGGSRFIVERFSPTRALQRPEEWIREEKKRESGGKCPPNIFMLDLNGHYAVGVGLLLETEAANPTPTFVMFNTTDGNYLSNGSPTVAFDLCFPAKEE